MKYENIGVVAAVITMLFVNMAFLWSVSDKIGSIQGEISSIQVDISDKVGSIQGDIASIQVDIGDKVGGIQGDISDKVGSIQGDIASIQVDTSDKFGSVQADIRENSVQIKNNSQAAARNLQASENILQSLKATEKLVEKNALAIAKHDHKLDRLEILVGKLHDLHLESQKNAGKISLK